jgi:hypothetical protein
MPIEGLPDVTGEGRQIPNYSYYVEGRYVRMAWAQFHPEDVYTDLVSPSGAITKGFSYPQLAGSTNINNEKTNPALKKEYELYDYIPIHTAGEDTANPFTQGDANTGGDIYYSFDLRDITDQGSIGDIRPEDLPKDEILSFDGFEDMSKLTPEVMLAAIQANGGQVPAEYQQLAQDLPGIYGNPAVYALELAMRDRENLDRHFVYRGSTPSDQWRKFNAGASIGANVTYEEEANGVDGQIIITPNDNYQALFSFSYTKREVTGGGFNLAPLQDPLTGEIITDAVIDPDTNEIVPPSEIVEGKEYRAYGDWMRYDPWQYQLGIWNFSNPADPTSFTGGSVNGLDLAMIPQWNLSLWNRYTFTEGPLEGLYTAVGVRYYSSAPTAVPIGGNGLVQNLFLTPDAKERYVYDLSFGYTTHFWGARWRFAFNISNLFDSQVDQTTVTYHYQDFWGADQTRTMRTRNVYEPRSWRFTVSAAF